MSTGTLWVYPENQKGKAIRAVAAYGGLELELPAYEHGKTNKEEAFLAKFPHGKVPTFETKDGFKLFESTPIARHLASLAPNSGLLGSSPEDAALVDQWTHFADSEIDAVQLIIFNMVKGLGIAYNKLVHTALLERVHRAYTTLNNYLATRTFLVGERITLADIWVAAITQFGTFFHFDNATRTKFPHLIRLVDTIVNQPKLAGTFSATPSLEKPLAFTPPAKEKKEKNPLDDLPKSSFNLEDWKRAYSNKDTRGADGALEWFYQNFDKDGFSIWRVDFKYNNELTQTFMSSNQIGGFFARLEASRKYLFGSVGVLGESNNSVISGIFILRGQEVEPVISAAPDWESYEYKKLDLANEADKAFFEGACAWDLEIDGKKWVDGKNFK
ncbi:eEF1-gamma domain-containing protein [Schizophyllum commune H4-8]|uniref:eEF1-gamma domain-containing protein n=1 Tax=Schizophyllum commune (strain H4-8 / FGSC 9210) TaxID=578458 RepID=UPI00215F0130|nr:eEF1-gamma domain-containing protein [Schizophyllum commune H4-8]KAI5888030.1 eEF1-gamma domain-containing protein [Schizophyllum commune H4-8]